MSETLPTLQFLVLGLLMSGELFGREIREALAKANNKKSLAAFYQLMSRMEDAKLVDGWYVHDTVNGRHIKERRYKITGSGLHAWERARDAIAATAGGLLGGLSYV